MGACFPWWPVRPCPSSGHESAVDPRNWSQSLALQQSADGRVRSGELTCPQVMPSCPVAVVAMPPYFRISPATSLDAVPIHLYLSGSPFGAAPSSRHLRTPNAMCSGSSQPMPYPPPVQEPRGRAQQLTLLQSSRHAADQTPKGR